jgi:hypothetical protein
MKALNDTRGIVSSSSEVMAAKVRYSLALLLWVETV